MSIGNNSTSLGLCLTSHERQHYLLRLGNGSAPVIRGVPRAGSYPMKQPLLLMST